MNDEEEIFNGEIEFKVKIKVEGKEPVITDIKRIVEDGLFETGNGLYRVTSITSDRELGKIKEKLEEDV